MASAAVWLFLVIAYVLHRVAMPASLSGSAPSKKNESGARLNRKLQDAGRWLFGILLLTGATLYLFGNTSLYSTVLLLHRWIAFSLLLWVLSHAAMQWRYNGWERVRQLLFSRLPKKGLVQLAILLPLTAATAFWFWRSELSTLLTTRLPVADIPLEIDINTDGIADEPAWKNAASAEVVTTGVGDGAAPVPVQVKALRQGAVIHFLFSWPDATPSREHLPLLKTEQGWIVQQTGFANNDEQLFYEDKFAVLLAHHSDVAAGAVQLGRHALATLSSSVSGRGYHATNGGIVDLWHWKSVRQHDTGQVDDNHFGPAYPDVPGEIRYTGGYKPDPSIAGGYSENWTWFREGVITPKRLPKDPALLAPFQQSNGQDQDLVWGMSWYETRPYSPELDSYPVGTRMPSVLWTTLFEGDRGDVRGRGTWKDGRWTLELVRGLKSTSPFDLDIGEGTFIWVSTFDHAQTRHGYHLRPLRLEFK